MKALTIVLLLFILPLCIDAQSMQDDFEEWPDRPGSMGGPLGWTGTVFGLGMEDSAYSGDYAVTVRNWYSSIVGFIITGEQPWVGKEFDQAGIPIDFLPTKMTGYYKYELGENRGGADSAAVYVMLKRYNIELERMDTLAYVAHLLPPAAEWTHFSFDLPLRMNGIQPDSVVIALYSSNPERNARCAGATCCYFTVDEISLTSTSGVRYDIGRSLLQARVVPNPIDRSGAIEFDGSEDRTYRLRLFDVAGRELSSIEFTGCRYDLIGQGLSAGLYYFSITDADGLPQISGRFVVE